MSEHTKEPWHQLNRKIRFTDRGQAIVIATTSSALKPIAPGVLEIDKAQAYANARHIVACVNICEGQSTKLLEELYARGLRVTRGIQGD